MFISYIVKRWFNGLQWPLEKDKGNSVSEQRTQTWSAKGGGLCCSFFHWSEWLYFIIPRILVASPEVQLWGWRMVRISIPRPFGEWSLLDSDQDTALASESQSTRTYTGVNLCRKHGSKFPGLSACYPEGQEQIALKGETTNLSWLSCATLGDALYAIYIYFVIRIATF